MSEIDANIVVDGQKTVATIPQEGEIVQDGGEIDATCIVEDSNGKRHKAVKIVNIDDEPSDKSEIDAQVLNNNNELITVTEEQEGEIIPQDNSEIDFHCLVQKDDGKQLSVKTVELNGEIIKSGGAIDATCVVNAEGKNQLAVKVFKKGSASGGTYYAYKDSSNNIIYTKGELANQGTFTLQNASVTGNLTNNAGFFSGFAKDNYLNINTTQPQNSFDLIVCANWIDGSGTYDLLKTQPDQKGILLHFDQQYAGRPIYAICYISSSGISWDTLVDFNAGAFFYESSIFQYVRIQWEATTGVYTFSHSLDGTNWTVAATSQGNLPAPYWSGNNQTIGGNSDYYYTQSWYRKFVDMANTSLTIDGVKTTYGTLTGASKLYDSNLALLANQRFYLNGSDVVYNGTTYTRSSADDRQA